MSVLRRRCCLFEGRAEEGVESYTKMLEEMWREKGRLMEMVERAGMA